MDCIQYYYKNPEDRDKYHIKCENMKFKNLNDLDKFNNNDLLEFVDEKYSDDAFVEDSPFTFSDNYINLGNDDICKTTDMSLGPQQKFMGQIMGPSSNFNNLLVYHGLGSGKTCTSIVVAESLKNATNHRIIYAVPAPLIDQYYEEISGEIRNGKFVSCPSFCLIKKGDGELERDIYVSETKNSLLNKRQKVLESEIAKMYKLEVMINNGDNSPLLAKQFKTQENEVAKLTLELRKYQEIIRGNIIRTFEIISHNKFIESLYKTGKNGQFIKNQMLLNDSGLFRENGLLIIDEIQRLVSAGGTFYKKLYDSIRYYFHPNLKLVLMSATPIYDNPYELALTINLLRPRLPFPIKDIDFYRYFIGEKKIVDGEEVCDKQAKPVNWIKDNSCVINQDLISYICSGYISYFKGGNPNAYPYKRIITIQHPFSSKHKLDYIDALYSDISKDKQLTKPGETGNSNYENVLLGNYDNTEDDKITGMFVTTQQYSNITLPKIGETVNKTLAEKKTALQTFRQNLRSIKGTNTDIIEYVKTVSTKFASIIELTLSSKGPVFIFSNWLKYGVEPLSIILEALGFINFQGDSGKASNKYFIWSSETKSKDPTGALIKRARNTFNSPENSDGNLLKVILGTRSVMEGVSFKNVRQVHITDPWWNESRIEQILARASRYCSHSNLPRDEQYVDIYRHYSVFPGEGEDDDAVNQIGNWKNLAVDSIDQKMLQSSIKKYAINNDFEKIIKSCSIDCNINKNGNIVRLEEHCIPVRGGMYQIYYKNPSNGRMYIREGIPELVQFSQIYNREFTFPRNDLPIKFIEAGFQADQETNMITPYPDSEILYDTDINQDLNMKEDIIPWTSGKTFKELDIDVSLSKYMSDLHSKFELIPTLRKNYLNETGTTAITFKDDYRLKDNLVKCIKSLASSNLVSEAVKRKIADEFYLDSQKEKINKKVLDLIYVYGAYPETHLEELLLIGISNPSIVNEAHAMYKNKTKNKM